MDTQLDRRLTEYVSAARARNVGDQAIHDELVATGWDTAAVQAALAATEILVPPPPPAPPPPGGASVAPQARVGQQPTSRGVEYLLMLLAMAITAITFGALLHNLVDAAFGYTGGTDGVITYAASALLVALPIFALLFLRIKRAERREASPRLGRWSRVAINVALVVAFLWGLFRVISYVYSLLNGNQADPFLGSNITSPLGNLLHTLVTLGIAGTIFAYWWRAPRHGPMVPYYVFIAALVVAGAVAGGVQAVQAGPVRADQALSRRIENLETALRGYAMRDSGLPATASEIPGDHAGITYQRGSANTFTLCAVFQTENVDPYADGRGQYSYLNARYHPRGRHCFPGTV